MNERATDERVYTLEEAKRELDRYECLTHGHSYNIVETTGSPVLLTCSRCDRSWSVLVES